MPIAPFRPIERFDPRYVTDEDLADLLSFMNQSEDTCLARVKDYNMTEFTEAWRVANPPRPDEVEICLPPTFTSRSRRKGVRFQIGSPIGERWSSWAATSLQRGAIGGCSSSAPASGRTGLCIAWIRHPSWWKWIPSFRLARHPFERHGLPGRFVESRSAIRSLTQTNEVVVCPDVFENLPYPLEAARPFPLCDPAPFSLRPGVRR